MVMMLRLLLVELVHMVLLLLMRLLLHWIMLRMVHRIRMLLLLRLWLTLLVMILMLVLVVIVMVAMIVGRRLPRQVRTFVRVCRIGHVGLMLMAVAVYRWAAVRRRRVIYIYPNRFTCTRD